MTEAALDATMLKKALRYDRAGEEHYNLISAYIKEPARFRPRRRALLVGSHAGGGRRPEVYRAAHDHLCLWKMSGTPILTPLFATAVFQAVERVGLPEAQINLAHGTTYLATSLKDNASYVGLLEALEDARALGIWMSPCISATPSPH